MTQAMINHYNYYQQQIQFLRLSGDILLDKIKTLETNMNRRKQQNQQPFEQDINSLNAMAKRLLQILAEINTCQYFQLTNEPFNCYSNYYIQMCNRYFEDIMQQFIVKLRIRRTQRLQRLQNLQHLHHLQHLQHLQSSSQNIIDLTDFQIEKL